MSKLLDEVSKYHDDWVRIAESFVDDYGSDIVQDMYILIHEKGLLYDDVRYEDTINKRFFYNVIKNLCIDYFRRRKDMVSIDNIMHVIEDDDRIDDSTFEKLKDLVSDLSHVQSEILDYRFKKKMKYKDIATETGDSINTLLSRTRYALNNLNKVIDKNNIKLR